MREDGDEDGDVEEVRRGFFVAFLFGFAGWRRATVTCFALLREE